MTIGLVLMTVSSILFAQLAGILQNPNEIHTARKVGLCETLAINCSLLAQRNDAQAIAANIQLVCQRNPEILSIGLRRNDGKLAYQVGDHAEHWHVDLTGSGDSTAHSTKDNILVPITHRGKAWGTLEVAFGTQQETAWSPTAIALQYPVLSLVAFCGLMNAGAIYFYLRRTLTYLDPAKAVPNRVRSALDTLAEGLVVLDSDQRIVLANQSFAKKLGQEPDQLQGVHVDKLGWQPAEDSSDIPPWEQTAIDKEAKIGQTIGLNTASEGERIFRVNAAPILDEEGDQRGVLASFDDITALEQKKAELHTMLSELSESREQIKKRNQELQILATRDALTGCLNRRTFFESFEKLWNGSKRHDQPLSCVMLDIDFFKSINDNYGH
ncbi:MAG: diguanylate cyclase, partial [Planctomycetota bacterium]